MKQTLGSVVIDWQHVRQRLATAIAATDAAQHLSPQRARQLMDGRAVALARVHAAPPSASETVELLVFSLGDERYALQTRLVREVQRQPEVTFVPGTPGFVRGVANLRGEVLAVIDLGDLFALGGPHHDDCPWLIVLGEEQAEFGIACDAVHEVLTLRTDAVCNPPGSLSDVVRGYTQGVTSDALIVLAGEILLDDQRLFVDQSDEAF